MANKRQKFITNPKYSKIFGNIGQSMEKIASEDLRSQGIAERDFGIYKNPEFSTGYTQSNYDGYRGDDETAYEDPNSDSSWGIDLAPIDGWRYLQQLKFQINMDEDSYDIANANERIENLDGYKNFINKYQQYKKTLQDLEDSKKNGNQVLSKKLEYDLHTKYGNINAEKQYWEEQSKKSPTLRKLIYGDAGFTDWLTAASRISGNELQKANDILKDATAKDVGLYLLSKASSLIAGPQNPSAGYVAEGLSKINKISKADNHLGKVVTSYLDPNATRYAISHNMMQDKLKSMRSFDLDNMGNAELANINTALNSDIEESKQDLSDAQARYTSHKQQYLTGNWYFDPTKISKEHRKRFDNANPADGIQAFFDSLPQIGSSISSLYSMGGQMGLSWATNAAVKAVPNPLAKAGLWIAGTLGQLALSSYMRQEETSSEVMDAWVQRVQDLSIKKQIDLGGILDKTKKFCKNVGINTDGLDEQELLRLSLAYNIYTGDKQFDKIKKDTRTGLKKVEDLNNALSTKDYLEAVMWNPIGGVGKNVKRYADDFVLKQKLAGRLGKSIKDVSEHELNIAKNVAQARRLSNESTLQKIRTVGSNIRNRISDLATKLVKSDKNKVAVKNLTNSLLSKSGKIATTAALEGIEEGQQALIQNRYQRGLYDDYVSGEFAENQYSPYINVKDFLEDGKIGTEAVSAYFGLNPTDPLNGDPELKRQMNIGASTSIFFAIPQGIISNASNNPESTRGIINQYKTDRFLISRIANNYKAQGNEEQIGTFFDAYKNGKRFDQVKKSYEAFKSIRNPETITDEDIAEDLEMAQSAYNIYERTKDKKDKTLDELHIDRDSDDHKEFVKNAVSFEQYFKSASNEAQKSSERVKNAVRDFRNKFLDNLEKFKNNSVDFQGSEIQKNIMTYFSQAYDEHLKNNQEKRASLSKDLEEKRKSLDKETDEDKKASIQNDIDKIERQIDSIKDIDVREYAQGVLNQIQQYREMRALQKLSKQLKNQHSHLALLEKLTHAGINTAYIAGMRNAIDKKIAKQKAEFDKLTQNSTDEQKELFNSIVKNALIETASNDEFIESSTANAMNQAIVSALTPRYMAYNLGWVLPNDVKDAYSRVEWDDLTEDQQEQYKQSYARKARAEGKTNDEISNVDYAETWKQENKNGKKEIDELLKQYKDIESKMGTDNARLPEDDRQKAFEIQQKLARILIKQDLADRIRRRKENEEYEEQNSPITQDDIDQAENGDEKAQRKIENAAKQQKDAAETDDPNDVRSQLGLERSDQPTEQQKRAADKLSGDSEESIVDVLKKSGAQFDDSVDTDEIVPKEEDVQKQQEEDAHQQQSESERLAQDAAEQKLKQEFFQNAQDFVNSEDFYDQLEGNDLSTLLQKKFNVSQEWADEFVKAIQPTIEIALNARDLYQRLNNAVDYLREVKKYAINDQYDSKYIQKLISDVLRLIHKYPTYKNPANFITAADKMLARVDEIQSLFADLIDDTQIDEEPYEPQRAENNLEEPGDQENQDLPEEQQEEGEPSNEPTIKETVDSSTGKEIQDHVVVVDSDDTPSAESGENTDENLAGQYKTEEDTFDYENSSLADTVGHIVDNVIQRQFEKINKEENAKDIEDLKNYILDLITECSDINTVINLLKKHKSFKKLQEKSDIFTKDLADTLNNFLQENEILARKEEYAPSSPNEQLATEKNDLSQFDIVYGEDGPVITYKGFAVTPLDLMMMGVDDTDQIYNPQENEDGKAGYAKSEMERRIGVTFFYQPNGVKPMDIKRDGNPIFTNKKLAPGKELAKKLQIPGWIKRVKKSFYIVHGNDADGNGTTADKLSVSIIFEDPDDSNIIYASSLRGTDNTYPYTHINHKSPYAKRRQYVGTDYEYIIDSLGSVGVNGPLFDTSFDKIINAKVLAVQQKDPSIKTPRDLKKSEKWSKLYWDEWDRCRKDYAIPGKTVYTYKQICENIEALRAVRQQIIEAYCDTRVTKEGKTVFVIPEQHREDVTPEQIITSNGSLNNIIDEDGQHSFRTIVGETAGFGLSSNIDELNQQIESGQIEMGVGTGPLGVTPGPNQIREINGSDDQLPGYGRAGKVYIAVPSESCPGTQGNKVVVQLHEQRFGGPIHLESNQDEGIDSSGNIKGDVKPSFAEILFRLVTKTINPENIVIKTEDGIETTISYEQLDALCNLVLNNGTKTLIGKVTRDAFGNISQNEQNKINILCHKLGYYSDKQICFVEKEDHAPYLLIGDSAEGIKTLSKLILSQMFPSKNATEKTKQKAEEIRKHVIALISKNMHWNTNVEMMTNIMPDEIYDMLESAFYTDGAHERRKIDTFSPFGDSLLSFNHDDFFNADGSRKNTTVLAWMLKSGKLTTDVGTNNADMFVAPYVFTNGMNAPVKQQPVVKETKQEKTSTKTTKQEQKKGQTITISKQLPKENKGIQIDESSNSSLITYDEKASKEDKIKQVLDKISALEKQGFKIEGKEKLSSKINKNGVATEDLGASNVILKKTKSGEYKILVVPKSTKTTKINGVYSTQGGDTLNRDSAKAWLKSKLGLSDQQVIVTGAVIDVLENGKKAYAATRTAVDAITGSIFGYISLSSRAGEGVQYHEAWHYVNLLLHNPAMRLKLYREFVKSHPELKGRSMAEIEEFMAEDFRAYMERRLDKKLSTRISRFFNNIWQFVKAMVGLKNNIYFTYRAIARGKYKNKPYNDQSIRQFQDQHGEYFYSVKDDKGNNIEFKSIDSYHAYYACAKYLTNIAIETLDLTTIDRIQSLSVEKLDSIFDKVQDQIDIYEDDEDSQYMVGLLQDIIDNKAGFKNIILQMLKSFSIEAKQAKTQIEESHEQGINDGTVYDNLWDIDHMSTSKKLNMGFAAKIFFSTLPKLITNGIVDGRVNYETATDPIFGSTEYFPFGQVWNKIMNNLYTCESFDDIDPVTGVYKSSSIVGQLLRLRKSDAFFESVYRKIQPLIDDKDSSVSDGRKLELKTQILNTIRSYKVQVTGGEFAEKKQFTKNLSQEQLQEMLLQQQETIQSGGSIDQGTKKVLSDIDKSWSLPDTNHLQSKYALARDWGVNFANGTGAVIYKDGHSVLNPEYVSKVRKLYNEAARLCQKQKRKTEKLDGYQEAPIEGAKQSVVELYNTLGIPIDQVILDRLIFNEIQSNPTAYNKYSGNEQQIAVLRSLVSGSDVTSALKILNWLIPSSGKTEIIKSTKSKDQQGTAFDQIFKGYATENKNGKLPWIGKMAVAYAETYPSGSEMSVTGADGAQIYPINMNNEVSDKCIALCENRGNIIEDYKKSAYAQHSILLNAALIGIKNNYTQDQNIKLNVLSYLKNKDNGESVDYFGMTPMEDYIMKMILTFNKRITFPTMADKKTWYSITSKALESTLNDDLIIPFTIDEPIREDYESQEDYEYALQNYVQYNIVQDGDINQILDSTERSKILSDCDFQSMRVGSKTLNTFYGYFVDELNTLIQYYDEKNIDDLKHHQHKLLINFHGKFVTEEVDSPNGLYKYTHFNFNGNGGKFRYFYDAVKEDGLNANMYMEYLYKKELLQNKLYIEKGQFDRVTDGFSSIRTWLQSLKVVGESEQAIGLANHIKKGINSTIMARVHDEFLKLSDINNSSLKLLKRDGKRFKNVGIPKFMIDYYAKKISEKYPDISEDNLEHAALVSLITNHVARTEMSIIEVEKIFTGDPAMYKWKNLGFDSLPVNVQKKYTKNITAETTLSVNGQEATVTKSDKIQLSVLQQKDVDKIKRLGGVLSPGTNLRTTFSKRELSVISHNEKRPDLAFGTDKYTFMNTGDIHAVSRYIKEVSRAMIQQQVVDVLQKELSQNDIIEHMKQFLGLKDTANVSKIMYAIYRYDDTNKLLNHIEQILGKDIVDEIKQNVENSMSPYNDITVSDAQVCVRPAMYRRLRIAIGEWTFEKDEDGYCDEDAYNMIESNDTSWMNDESKYNKVRKFILKPLKMSFFQNKTNGTIGTQNVLLPIYNKMAIFPMFKFACQSGTGKQIYERMNRKGSEIDMLGFESAVKVGCNQQMFTPYSEGTTTMDDISDTLNNDSSVSIDYKTGKENRRVSKQNQELSTYPNGNKQKEITNETQLNAVQVQSMNDLHLQLNTDPHEALERAVGTQMFKICFSNIVGNMVYGQDSIHEKGRKGYQIRNDIMNIVNAMTQKGVNEIRSRFFIKTKDGFYKPNQKAINDYVLSICKNNGIGEQAEQILKENGVIASLQSREVFEHSISSMVNKKVIDITTNGGAAVQQSCFGFEGFNNKKVMSEKEYEKGGLPVLNDGKHLKWYKKNGSMEVILSLNFFRHVVPNNYQKTPEMMRTWLIENDIIKGTKKNGNQSNPKPFGLGYRIPTQGMSSIFTFTVADVLPELSGDVIIVPTEFTAQTGSDFDVDKLYLATYSYDQEDETSVRSSLKSAGNGYNDYIKEDNKALRNALLDNYSDIVSDYKNISDARASIDVLTAKLKSEIVPLLSDNMSDYIPAMTELSPNFQSRRKMEYSVGKDGIGPFALNVTNLALTQYCELGLQLDGIVGGIFKFGNIDDIKGRDGMYISAWLSAMVNAHVDVAKDPYILTLNVNQATYKYVNLLLRCGLGKSTFTFIAQPYLKRFADKICNGKGMYGTTLEGSKIANVYENGVIGDLKKEAINNFITYYNLAKQKKQSSKELDEIVQMFELKKDSYKFKSKARHLFYQMPRFNLFDERNASKYLRRPSDAYDYIKQAEFYVYQFAVCDFLSTNLSQPAQALSDLVRLSRIDTKKFGNNIISQLNFLNSYQQFKNGKTNKIFELHGLQQESKKLATKFKPYTEEQKKTLTTINLLNAPMPVHMNYQDNDLSLSDNVIEFLKNNNVDVSDTKLKEFLNFDFKTFEGYSEDIQTDIDKYLKNIKFVNGSDDITLGMNVPKKPKLEPVDNMDELQKQYVQKQKTVNEYYNTYPLHYYFNKTFLDKKLRCAIDLNQELLESETTIAQPIFKKLYTSLMASIFGTVEYDVPYIVTDDKGNTSIETIKKLGYEEVMNDDRAVSIGRALETIMRHRSFLYQNLQKKEQDDGLDLTCNNDEEEAFNKMKILQFGNDSTKSLAERLETCKTMLCNMYQEAKKNNNIPDYLQQLFDENGKIQNDFLNLVKGFISEDDSEPNRIVLNQSAINIDQWQKSKITAAIDELHNISTTSEEKKDKDMVLAIRRLLDDLLFYSYYSTYNNGGVNQFFDLSPVDLIQQYISGVSKAVKQYGPGSMVDFIIKDNSGRGQLGELNLKFILDLIFKNYWNNKDIVKEYEKIKDMKEGRTIGKDIYVNDRRIDTYVVLQHNNINGQFIESVYALPSQRNPQPYITIRHGKELWLYQMTGVVVRKVKKVDESIKIVPVKYIYRVTNKLGNTIGRNKQYEFFGDDTRSMYEKNNISIQVILSQKISEMRSFPQDDVKNILIQSGYSTLKDLANENIKHLKTNLDSNYDNILQCIIDSFVELCKNSWVVEKQETGDEKKVILANSVKNWMLNTSISKLMIDYDSFLVREAYTEQQLTEEIIPKLKEMLKNDKKQIINYIINAVGNKLLQNRLSFESNITQDVIRRDLIITEETITSKFDGKQDLEYQPIRHLSNNYDVAQIGMQDEDLVDTNDESSSDIKTNNGEEQPNQQQPNQSDQEQDTEQETVEKEEQSGEEKAAEQAQSAEEQLQAATQANMFGGADAGLKIPDRLAKLFGNKSKNITEPSEQDKQEGDEIKEHCKK